MVANPIAIDLCSGLGGWAEGLEAEGYDVIRVDIEDMFAATGMPKPDPCLLMLQDIRTLHGSQFKHAALIVASPPCQAYSYMAMPWNLAKAKAAAIRADKTGAALERLNELFNACFRIQREACEAAGRHIPMVVENVRGAEPWVGRARWNFGSFYLWGDIPALMPPISARKNGHVGGGSWFNIGSPGQTMVGGNPDGRKVPGFRFDGSGRSFQSESVQRHVVDGVKHPGHSLSCGRPKFGPDNAAIEGRKGGGDWFGAGADCSLQRRAASGSTARKAASAAIAKIPLPLAQHIARVWKPIRASEAA